MPKSTGRHIVEESLEVKLPTFGQMQQQRWEETEKRESVEKKMKAYEGRKLATHKHCVFPMGLRRVEK